MANEKATTPTPQVPTPPAPKAPQKPSIGRVVIYTNSGGYPRPAIVTDLEDGITSLTVFNPRGSFYMEDVEFSETPEPGCWSWPQRS